MTVANLPSWAPASIDPSKLQQIPGGGDFGFPGAYGPSLTEGGLNFTPGGNTASGFYTTRGMPGGGTQSVYYNPQGQATDVSGHNPDTGSLLDNIIKYGAMAGGAVAAGGGLMGFGSPGPGAAALGGSSDLVAGAGAAAPELGGAAGTGMTFDNSALVDQIANTAGANVAPQLASDASNIAAQGMAGIEGDIGAGSSGLSSLLNKDLANALMKAGGQIFGGPGGGSAGGQVAGGGNFSGSAPRSFATYDAGESGMPQQASVHFAPVGPVSYGGGQSPAMLAAALREMTGRNYGGYV